MHSTTCVRIKKSSKFSWNRETIRNRTNRKRKRVRVGFTTHADASRSSIVDNGPWLLCNLPCSGVLPPLSTLVFADLRRTDRCWLSSYVLRWLTSCGWWILPCKFVWSLGGPSVIHNLRTDLMGLNSVSVRSLHVGVFYTTSEPVSMPAIGHCLLWMPVEMLAIDRALQAASAEGVPYTIFSSCRCFHWSSWTSRKACRSPLVRFIFDSHFAWVR